MVIIDKGVSELPLPLPLPEVGGRMDGWIDGCGIVGALVTFA